MVKSDETRAASDLGREATAVVRSPVSSEEQARRVAWGNEWGAHAREDAARRERER